MKFSTKLSSDMHHMSVFMSGVLSFETYSSYSSLLKEVSANLETIELNMKNVERLDSTAIGFLFELANRANENEIQLNAILDNEYLKKKFELTKLDKVMNIYE